LPGRWGSAPSQVGGRESLDHPHRASALRAGPEGSRNISLGRAADRWRGGRCGQQREAQREQLRTAPVSQEPEVPDAHKAPRQHVQKEPPQKLIQRQPHPPLLVVVRRVAPSEHDLFVLEGHQTVIGDRHPVRVTAEIAERVFGSAERTFGVDHQSERNNSRSIAANAAGAAQGVKLPAIFDSSSPETFNGWFIHAVFGITS